MKKQKDVLKVVWMKEAHRFAKNLCKINGKSYRENLSTSMKAKHLKYGAGKNGIDEVNWIKNNIPSNLVQFKNVTDFGKNSRYTVYIDSYGELVEVKQQHIVDQSYMNSLV